MPRDNLIVARAERLCLLYAAHKARRQHRTSNTIMRRLRRTTARIIEMLEAEGFISAPDATGKRTIVGEDDDGEAAA